MRRAAGGQQRHLAVAVRRGDTLPRFGKSFQIPLEFTRTNLEAIFAGRWGWQGVGGVCVCVCDARARVRELILIQVGVCQPGHRLSTSWAVFAQSFGRG